MRLANQIQVIFLGCRLVLVIVWLWGQFGKNSPRFILTFFKIARTQWGWFEKRQNETRVYFSQIARWAILFRINRMTDYSLVPKFCDHRVSSSRQNLTYMIIILMTYIIIYNINDLHDKLSRTSSLINCCQDIFASVLLNVVFYLILYF